MIDTFEKLLIKVVKFFYHTYKIELFYKYDNNNEVIDTIIITHSKLLWFNLSEWYNQDDKNHKDTRGFSLHAIWEVNK